MSKYLNYRMEDNSSSLKMQILESANIVSERDQLNFTNLVSLSANGIIKCIEISKDLKIDPKTWLSGMRIYSKLQYILDNKKELLRLPISEEDFGEVSILAQYLNIEDDWKSGCTPNSVWLEKIKKSIRPSVRV